MAGIKGEELKRYDHRYHTPHRLVDIVRKSVEGVPIGTMNGDVKRKRFKLQLPVAVWNYIAALAGTAKVDMAMKFVRVVPHRKLAEHQLNWVHFLSNNFHQSKPAACITGHRRAQRTTALCVWASAEARIFPGTRIRLVPLSQRAALKMHAVCGPMVRDAFKHGTATWVLDNSSVIECTSLSKPAAKEFSVVAYDDADMMNAYRQMAKTGFCVSVIRGQQLAANIPTCSLVRKFLDPEVNICVLVPVMQWSEKDDELAAPVKKLGEQKDTL